MRSDLARAGSGAGCRRRRLHQHGRRAGDPAPKAEAGGEQRRRQATALSGEAGSPPGARRRSSRRRSRSSRSTPGALARRHRPRAGRGHAPQGRHLVRRVCARRPGTPRRRAATPTAWGGTSSTTTESAPAGPRAVRRRKDQARRLLSRVLYLPEMFESRDGASTDERTKMIDEHPAELNRQVMRLPAGPARASRCPTRCRRHPSGADRLAPEAAAWARTRSSTGTRAATSTPSACARASTFLLPQEPLSLHVHQQYRRLAIFIGDWFVKEFRRRHRQGRDTHAHSARSGALAREEPGLVEARRQAHPLRRPAQRARLGVDRDRERRVAAQRRLRYPRHQPTSARSARAAATAACGCETATRPSSTTGYAPARPAASRRPSTSSSAPARALSARWRRRGMGAHAGSAVQGVRRAAGTSTRKRGLASRRVLPVTVHALPSSRHAPRPKMPPEGLIRDRSHVIGSLGRRPRKADYDVAWSSTRGGERRAAPRSAQPGRASSEPHVRAKQPVNGYSCQTVRPPVSGA